MAALLPAVVSALAVACGHPEVPVQRVLATVQVESGDRPYAIHDNTEGRSYTPETREGAVILAAALLRLGHSFDAGLMQVNSGNWERLGLTVQNVFDPQVNVCAGMRVLAEDYAIERHVSCRYNTGQPECTNGYPERIAAASQLSVAEKPASEPACSGWHVSSECPNPASWHFSASPSAAAEPSGEPVA